jgi:cell division protein FtsB
MKFYAAALAVVLLLLQYRLWVTDDGLRSVRHLQQSVRAQRAENKTLSLRNGQLVAEVRDLKEGTSALEERARNDLGMIGANETFFQVAEAPAAVAEPAPALLQRVAR